MIKIKIKIIIKTKIRNKTFTKINNLIKIKI